MATPGSAQAALFLEQPYGFFGTVNPTGHEAIYLRNICAETPIRLRRCHAGEDGVVISRYGGIGHYDWAAVPPVPYLYAVEDAAQAPERADRGMVSELRDRYRERHLMDLGANLRAGSFFHGGWAELVGASYERRVYAFRFATTPEQDDRIIALMNGRANHTHFSLLFNNCADFAREILNAYFPGQFQRSLFPDAGMTTPKQITYKLVKFGRKHPDIELTVVSIPQIPGNRRHSGSNHGVAEMMITEGYAIPIAMLNPYIAGGLFVDYLVRGRSHLIPKNLKIAEPNNLNQLTGDPIKEQDLSLSMNKSSGDPDYVASSTRKVSLNGHE